VFGMSAYTIISSIWKIAAARPTSPILKVFSRKCGVSETKEPGMAIETSCVRRVGAVFSFKVFKRVSRKDLRLTVF